MNFNLAARSLAKACSAVGLGFLALSHGAAHAAICPTTFYTNTDCGFMLSVGTSGAVSGSAVAGANPYDGADDALVGIVNNSGSVFTGSFTMSGSGNGGGIFAFEGDGISIYTGQTFGPTGYEGPLVSFSNINAAGTLGTVNITGLGAGATTYFSLEGSPNSIAAAGGIGVPAVPEPETWGMMTLGVLVLSRFRRRPMHGSNT